MFAELVEEWTRSSVLLGRGAAAFVGFEEVVNRLGAFEAGGRGAGVEVVALDAVGSGLIRGWEVALLAGFDTRHEDAIRAGTYSGFRVTLIAPQNAVRFVGELAVWVPAVRDVGGGDHRHGVRLFRDRYLMAALASRHHHRTSPILS